MNLHMDKHADRDTLSLLGSFRATTGNMSLNRSPAMPSRSR